MLLSFLLAEAALTALLNAEVLFLGLTTFFEEGVIAEEGVVEGTVGEVSEGT